MLQGAWWSQVRGGSECWVLFPFLLPSGGSGRSLAGQSPPRIEMSFPMASWGFGAECGSRVASLEQVRWNNGVKLADAIE